MSCEHRFLSDLNPSNGIEYLFIGTFNPFWDSNSSSILPAIYFYGRSRNNFWTIIPNIFGGLSLKKSSKEVFVKYTDEKKIGITDLITRVMNADENNPSDVNNLTKGFCDSKLAKYELEFSTESILNFIDKNKATLRGVYLTRSTSGGIKKIWAEWQKITTICSKYSIETVALKTPANYGGGPELKTKKWKEQSKMLNAVVAKG